MRKINRIAALLVVLLLALALTGCSSLTKETLAVDHAGYTAILETPDGRIISGYCTNWNLGGSGTVIADIDGTVYITHIKNVLFYREEGSQ